MKPTDVDYLQTKDDLAKTKKKLSDALFELDCLRKQKDTWGNEFNAVILIKQDMDVLREELNAYKRSAHGWEINYAEARLELSELSEKYEEQGIRIVKLTAERDRLLAVINDGCNVEMGCEGGIWECQREYLLEEIAGLKTKLSNRLEIDTVIDVLQEYVTCNSYVLEPVVNALKNSLKEEK